MTCTRAFVLAVSLATLSAAAPASPITYERWLEDGVQVGGSIAFPAGYAEQAPIFYRFHLGPKPPGWALSSLSMRFALAGSEADLAGLIGYFAIYHGLFQDTEQLADSFLATGPTTLVGRQAPQYYGTMFGIDSGDYTVSFRALCMLTCDNDGPRHELTLFGPLEGSASEVPEPNTALLLFAALVSAAPLRRARAVWRCSSL